MVIAVLGLIGGAMLTVSAAKTEDKKLARLDEQLAAIDKAIQHHVRFHGYLPCPAQPLLPENDPGYGRATCTATGGITLHSAASADDDLLIGIVPTRTLNMSDRYMYDPWGSRISYSVINKLAGTPSDTTRVADFENYTTTLTNGVIAIQDAAGNQMVAPETENVVAYALISHGKDKKGAFPRQIPNTAAPPIACGATALDAENCDADDAIIDAGILESDVSANYYYDRVSWHSLIELRSLLPDSGTPPALSGGNSYFVLSNESFKGDFDEGGESPVPIHAGKSAGRSICAYDLWSYNWNGKDEALAAGTLYLENITAFVCGSSKDGVSCDDFYKLAADREYFFARSGSATAGGDSFITDTSGRGPNNNEDWSVSSKFGADARYWTGIRSTNSTRWGYVTDVSQNCTTSLNHLNGAFTSESSASDAIVGRSAATDENRWNNTTRACSTKQRLICVINGETSTGPDATGTGAYTGGYFVLSKNKWKGNLGGISGADAKCLNDLTSNDWKDKSDAVSRGLLTASNVKSFICDNSTCNIMPQGAYKTARSGSITTGGTTFYVDGNGFGPYMSGAPVWSTGAYFGVADKYWTGYTVVQQSNGATANTMDPGFWAPAPWNDHCNKWTSSDSGDVGFAGKSDANGRASYERWGEDNHACDKSYRLICVVGSE